MLGFPVPIVHQTLHHRAHEGLASSGLPGLTALGHRPLSRFGEKDVWVVVKLRVVWMLLSLVEGLGVSGLGLRSGFGFFCGFFFFGGGGGRA